MGLILRVYKLGKESLWFDEVFSVWISQMNLSAIMEITGADVHPPLYYFILHYWIVFFGTSEVVVRSLSVLFGVLAIPVIYVLGRQLFNKQVGLLAALLLALSGFNIQYSQEARMYSLMVLLALLSMFFFIRFLHGNTVAISIGYILCTTLLLYTHLYGAFVVIAQNIYLVTLLLLSRERVFQLRQWLILQVLLVALFAPWIRFLTGQVSSVEQGFGISNVQGYGGPPLWIPPPTIISLIDAFINYAGKISHATYLGNPMLLLPAMLLGLFFVLSVLALFSYRKVSGSMDWKTPLKALKSYMWEVSFTKDHNALYFLAVWLLAINVIPFVISLFSRPIYYYKYTIPASVALYLIVAKGISHINYQYAKLAVVIVIIALSAANLQAYYTTPSKPQARDVIGFIDKNAKDGDLVLLVPGESQFVYNYYYKFLPPAGVTMFPSSSSGQDLASNIQELQSYINGRNRVWLVEEPFWDTSNLQVLNQTEQTLKASYNEIYFKRYYGYDVYLFEKQA